MKKVFIFISLFISLFLALSIFIWQGIYLPRNDLLRGLPKDLAFLETEDRFFSVEKGQNLFQISKNLEKEGLIKNRFFFNFYVIVRGKVRQLQVGEYLFNSSLMSTAEIAEKIISGDVAKIVVTIPEGFTVKQIEERLNLKLPGENLEGFLFPETYQFLVGVSGEEVVRKMRENFEKKITPDLRAEIERQGKTIFEIVTMASLIEKEVRTKGDKELVSGILWKRLETGMPLQVDATLAYIYQGEKNWTFREMLREIGKMRKIDSPYNTYKYLGLPPGPICNPGLKSILAALYPKSSKYWFYLSTPEGETIFSKTLEEHNYAKAKYLR